MDVALEARDLVKHFGDVAALDGLSMSVPTGSVYGLVGPNGAGKSTLISALAGTIRPTSGEVLTLGRPALDAAEVKARMAVIPSEPYFLSGESVDGMASFLRGVNPRFDRGRFLALAKAFDLDRKKPLRKLSKGMRRQAAFWLALSQRPEVLLLDEPMDGLDPLMRRRVWRLVMGEVAETGLTVLVSSHNLRELEGVCDHLGIIAKGRMLRENSLDDASSGLVKVQLVLPEGASLPQDLAVEHKSADGRLLTLVVRGDAERVRASLSVIRPVFMQMQPLSLEELFLFEMGGSDDDPQELFS